jgi:AcrR family transcriptional regulator
MSSPRTLLAAPERQASILRGAAVAFARSGYAATSMEDVAAACGITKLIVYRHFESKEDLYRAVLQRVFDRQAEEFVARLSDSPQRGVGARTFMTVAREDPDAFVLLWRHAAREPQFADYAREHRDMAVAAARHLLGAEVGEPAVDRWMAEAVVSWLVESVLAWLEVGDPAADDRCVELTTLGLRAMRDTWRAAATT